MNIFTGIESTELFGGEVPQAVQHLVDEARQAPREQVAASLWAAALSVPQSLPVYYLLYKLHAGLGELDAALQAAHKGLAAASRAAGLSADWQTVRPGDADFNLPGAARFWLFTLKALAFIHLRRGERDTAQAYIGQLLSLDPADQLGGSVVQGLLWASA